MLSSILQRLAEVERRLANVFVLGTIIETNYDKALVKAKAGNMETGWLPWITSRAGNDVDFWAPEVGEQVLIMSPGGDPEFGVILPALYQNNYPATDNRSTIRRVRFADGADFSYDREAKALKIILPAGATSELVSDGGIQLTGNTTIQGQLHVTDNIKGDKDITDQTRSMQADRDIYNDHDHPHGDPIVGKVNQKQ
ncbi:phage baseplate assembly protein V [Paraneptunicella aestuarii]|uniref:phage baseplate assembly protein V n=1 Tax=Paraneptunicella aestuarii TaxID=2831148 RepID=UPI001E62EB61|nr:phage baseplate assembly protein V [Paraneptunicella aestuarii]UAA38213.1 phage baseplate assembly protein V [Paraneptunicella aestuarii]